MTVDELIKQLADFPPEAPVHLEVFDRGGSSNYGRALEVAGGGPIQLAPNPVRISNRRRRPAEGRPMPYPGAGILPGPGAN